MIEYDRVLSYDRVAHTLHAPDRAARRHARLLQAAHRALAPVGYAGISRVFALINRLAPAGVPETVVSEGSFQFRFPADDYYWNRLLDWRWHYEPEIDAFLASIRDRPWGFVDLGANFGYWSARVGWLYGPRRIIAVEPSSAAFAVLSRNVEPFRDAALAVRRAVADESGAEVALYGTRHLGFSIDAGWDGGATVADRVTTVTLDDLLREAGMDPVTTPLVVKLDVEGVERQVLEGAPQTVAGNAVFLIEDGEGPGRIGDGIAYAHELGMRLYAMEEGGVRRLEDAAAVLHLKPARARLQRTGINLAATASPEWWRVLEGER